MSYKAVSPIIIAVDSVRSCTLAGPLATWRHALKNKKENLLGQIKLSQIYPKAVYCIRDYLYLFIHS